MKRFNNAFGLGSQPSTRWCCSGGALGVAGFFSISKLGRAEDPFFNRQGGDVSAIWRARAPRNADPGRRPHQKKLQECRSSRRCRRYFKTVLSAAMQGLIQGFGPRRRMCRTCFISTVARRIGGCSGPVAGRLCSGRS